MTDHNLEAGLRLVDAGFHIHPCNPNPRPHPQSKHPLTKWLSASTCLAQGVRNYSDRYPGAVYGIHLGRANAVVVDLDQHSGGHDGVAEFDLMLDYFGSSLDGVPIVETASGGYHLWFAQPSGREPLGNSPGSLKGLGIDVRGDGGFVIGPGAVMYDGTYYACADGWPDLCETFRAKALPPIFPWLVELIETPTPGRERGPSSSATPGEQPGAGSPDDAEAAERHKRGMRLAGLRAGDLARVREGGRNIDLNSAVMTIAGRAWWSGISKSECLDLMMWACGINRYIEDDGLPAFTATFEGAWRDGLAKPLRAPRDRDADNGTVTINLRPKLNSAT